MPKRKRKGKHKSKGKMPPKILAYFKYRNQILAYFKYRNQGLSKSVAKKKAGL